MDGSFFFFYLFPLQQLSFSSPDLQLHPPAIGRVAATRVLGHRAEFSLTLQASERSYYIVDECGVRIPTPPTKKKNCLESPPTSTNVPHVRREGGREGDGGHNQIKIGG